MKFAKVSVIQAALVVAALARRPADGGEVATLKEALAKKDGELVAERTRNQELEAEVHALEGRLGVETQKEFSLESRLALIRSALASDPGQPAAPKPGPPPLAPSATAAEVLDADEDESSRIPTPASAAPVPLDPAHGPEGRDPKSKAGAGKAKATTAPAAAKGAVAARGIVVPKAANTASAAKVVPAAAEAAAPIADNQSSPGQDADLDALDSQLKEEEHKMQELNSAGAKSVDATKTTKTVVAKKPQAPPVVAVHLGRSEVAPTAERLLEHKHDVPRLQTKKLRHRVHSVAAPPPPVVTKPLDAADINLDIPDISIKAVAPPPAKAAPAVPGILKVSIGAPLTQEGDVSAGLDVEAQKDEQVVSQLTQDSTEVAAASDPADDAVLNDIQ